MERSTKWVIGIFVCGLVLTVFGFVLGYAIYPAVAKKKVREELNLWNQESEGRKNFETPPVPIYMNFYMWDVLNPDSIADGTGKPHLKERGPYAYREIRKKVNVSHQSESDCYIRAGQHKTYIFDESKSCAGCKADDRVTMINAPLLGIVSTGLFMRELNQTSIAGCSDPTCTDFNEDYKDSLFINTTVDDFIFRGHKHGVLKWIIEKRWGLVGKSMPAQVTQEAGFAMFNQKNDTASNESYEFDTAYCSDLGKSDYGSSDMKLYMDIRQWGKSQDELHSDLDSVLWWNVNGSYEGSNACNRIEGTDGQTFHPGVTKDDKLWIFSTDLCRSIFITYQGNVDIQGIPALQFAPPPQALQVNTTDNVGFCMEAEKWVNWTTCIKKTDNPEILNLEDCYKDPGYLNTCWDGVLNITRCMSAPAIISSPHFYQSPDFLRLKFDGIEAPNAAEHESRFTIEPTTGMLIKLRKRIQVNIPLFNTPMVDLLAKVKPIELFPMVWVDGTADIDEANVSKLKSKVVTPTRAVIGVQWTCVAVGILAMVGSVIYFFVQRKKKNSQTI